MLSDFVIAYLFLGGTGGGALSLLCILELANARRRFHTTVPNCGAPFRAATRHRSGGFRALFVLPDEVLRGAWLITATTLALAILFLFLDLGRPERVWAILLHPTFSAITVGAYALVVALVISAMFCGFAFLDNLPPVRNIFYLGSVMGILVGFTVISYTGILLMEAPSVLFWQTWLLPTVFALSSFSGGIGVIMLSAAFANTRQPFSNVLMRLGDADFFIILLELALFAVWLSWGAHSDGPATSAMALLTGPLSKEFWLGLVAGGMVLPLFLEQYLSYGNHKTQTLMISGLLLFGAAMLRWCVVQAGGFDVTQTEVGIFVAGGILI